jgi:hypothetical protein
MTCCEKVTVENKENVSVAETNFKCQSTDVTRHDSGSQHNVAEESKGNVSVEHAHSGSNSVSQVRTLTGNTHSVVADSTYTCQKTSVTRNEPTNMMMGNKEIAGVADSVQRVSDICTSLAEGSEMNFSVSESEPDQISISCRRSLLFSPIEKCPLRPSTSMTRWPGRSKDTHGVQSVEDFSVDNYFGFDEESEDDLHVSLTPVKVAPRSKPVSSVPFAVSSTPNAKLTFTRPKATSMRLMQSIPQTRTPLVSIQSATAPEHSLPSDVEPPDIADVGHAPSPPALFVDKSDPVTHFMKVSLTQGVVLSLH